MDFIYEPADSWVRDHFEGTNPFIGDVVAEAVWWAELMAGVRMVDQEREALIDRYRHDLAIARTIGDSDDAWWDRFSDHLQDGLTGETTLYTRWLASDPQSRLARLN